MAYGSPLHKLTYEQSCFLEKCQTAAANADLTSSAHVPGKLCSFFQIPFNETSSGQQRESSKQFTGEHFPKGSDLNNNTGLKPGAFSFSTHSVALKGVSAQRFYVPEMSFTSSPLLLDLLEGKLFDLESSNSTMSTLKRTTTNVETPEKNSLLTLNCGQKMAQNPDYSGVTDQTFSQQNMSPFSPSSLPFLRDILAGGEARPFTDEEINCVIKNILKYWKPLITKNINDGLQVHSLPRSDIIPATKEDTERGSLSAAGQCTTAAGRAIEASSQIKSKASSKGKHHKENLQIVREVAATSTKNEEDSPLVVAAVSEECPNSTHSCSSSQEDWSNADKDQHAGGKEVKKAWLYSVMNMSHCHVPAHSTNEANNSNPKQQPMCGQTSANPSLMEGGAYVHSLPPIPHPVTVLKDTLYDDISDSDSATQTDPKTQNEEQNEFHVSALSQYSMYEDVSKDEGLQSCPPELSKPSIEQDGHVQDEMENVTNVVENEDQTDDWLVIPLMISDIKFESGDEDQTDQEVIDNPIADGVEHGDERRPGGPVLPQPQLQALNPAAASSLFSPIEVYDTLENFKQANIAQYLTRDLAQESSIAHTLLMDTSSDPEDSCETENSSDYSDDSEHNYLTVSRKLLTCFSPAASSKSDESDKEKENVQRRKTRRRSKKTKKDDVIAIDSDTEDSNPITRQYRDKESVDTHYNTETFQQSVLPSSGQKNGLENKSERSEYALCGQNLSGDESVIIIGSDTEDDTDKNYGEGASPLVDSERETAQRFKLTLSGMSRSIKSGQLTDGEGKTNILSTESEDSDNDTQSSLQEKIMLYKTSPSSKKEPHSVERGSPSTSDPNPMIPRYTFTHVSSSSVVLNRLKQTIQKHNKAVSLQTSKETKTPDSSKAHLPRDKKGKLVSKPEPKSVHHTSPVSQLKQSSSSSRLHCPNKNSSALHHPHTATGASSSSAVQWVTREWKRSYHPIRRDGKTCPETEEAIPGPSRSERVQQRRHSCQESIPPLMKRSKVEARQLTANATNRISQGERKYPVGKGYKWRTSAKGGSMKRRRSPPISLDGDEDPSSSYVCYN